MLNQINAKMIGSGLLNLQQGLPSPSLESYLWKQRQVFESVNNVAVATVTSSFLGFERQGDSSIQIVVSDRATGYNLRSYSTESHGNLTKLLQQTPNFNPSTRPWYKAAVQAGKPTWSEIYTSFYIKVCTSVADNEHVEIRIADNGRGMTEEVRRKLFDPFFTTKPVGQGTGLGLSVSYQIVVEKHGGKLQCVSALGQGAEFVILIPIHQPQ